MRTELVTTSAIFTGGAVTRLCAFIPNPVRPGNPPGQLSINSKLVLLSFPPRQHWWRFESKLFPSQFTKRVMRTFITIPSARNVNNTDDPP